MMPLAFWGGSPGAGELVVIFAVLLLFFGAKKLPSIARTMGRTLEEFRRAARDFSNDIMHADRNDFTEDYGEYPDKNSAETDVGRDAGTDIEKNAVSGKDGQQDSDSRGSVG